MNLIDTRFVIEDESIGINQTWQDVLASRVLDTTYTNTTGNPIQVSVLIDVASDDGAKLSVDGIDVGEVYVNEPDGAAMAGQLSAIVPNGSIYRVSITAINPVITSWAELR